VRRKRCAPHIMKVNVKKIFITSMSFIFIHSLKYVYIFLILYTKCARKCLCFTVRREPNKFEKHCATAKPVLRYVKDGNRRFKLHRKKALCVMKRTTAFREHGNWNAIFIVETEDSNMWYLNSYCDRRCQMH
jgi:hypothetical protein